MSRYCCSQSICRRTTRIGAVLLLLCLMPYGRLASGAQTDPSQASGAAEKIHVTADSLLADNQSKNVAFVGNVRATQGSTVITCKRLDILYDQPGRQEDPATDSAASELDLKAGAAAISRIIASGTVKIEFEDYVAFCDTAEFVVAERKVVLKGADTKMISGDNSISGSMITIYQDGGRIAVEGNQQKRVEAYFSSEEGTLPSFGGDQ